MTGTRTTAGALDVALEIGTKRTFAVALDWPGWSRSGRDEAAAIEALLASAPRYGSALRGSRLGFRAPAPGAAIRVAERLPGDATTDFGAPGGVPSVDEAPMDEAVLRRSLTLLRACRGALDAAVEAAAGRRLRTGPRGGGRDVGTMLAHVADAEGAYLRMIGVRLGPATGADPLEHVAAVAAQGLTSAVREGVPPSPRGGKRWTPRTYVRRAAWHLLDHAWEIEDRLQG